jgi:cell fate (sporulation/competence/biofilm development) regulator YlbF (YheA/YmcA/DUF963 family)
MNHEVNEFSDASDLFANDRSVAARVMWRQDSSFIVDGTGKKVAEMQCQPAEHEWHQYRILTALNAMQDTLTQFIEELVDSCQDNILLELITRDREMATALKRMEETIAAHCCETKQLREMMDACRVFEEQRAVWNQLPALWSTKGCCAC